MSFAVTSPYSVLFPGQGSQENNMGRDLAEASTDIMDLWKKAERISKQPLREVYWDGDADAMADTRYLQPALTVVNLSLWIQLASQLSPVSVAGHSLGEYSALGAAQVLSVDNILELVSLRGQLMADADPSGTGAMAAILKMKPEDVNEMVTQAADETGKLLLVANYNTPAQLVISGHKTAVDAACKMTKERKGRAIPLAVSGAFHSPLMNDAAAELGAYMKKLDWRAPKFPVVFNATATTCPDPAQILEVMATQMTSSVRWIETMGCQYDMGSRGFIELGPKGVLTRMLAANLKGREDKCEGRSVGNLEQAEILKNEFQNS